MKFFQRTEKQKSGKNNNMNKVHSQNGLIFKKKNKENGNGYSKFSHNKKSIKDTNLSEHSGLLDVKKPKNIFGNAKKGLSNKSEDQQNNHEETRHVENDENTTCKVETASLPVSGCRKKLTDEFMKCSTFIIIGETGSGKTTQIPQFIYDDKLHKNRCIAITQPRRIAAISMAKRVCEEREELVGTTVGYSVRFEDMTSEKTVIKYMTDGMLLREAMADSSLKKYSWIILDEAHERTINTDVLFGVVKEAQKTRSTSKTKKRLKIIVMSATMDVDSIKTFFHNSKVLYIHGREFPVDINYIKTPLYDSDYVNGIIKTIFQLHQSLPLQDHILAFLTGQDEIESAAHFIRKVMQVNNVQNLEVKTLYANLPQHLQMEALATPHKEVRRCILSTNVAETSLTIPGVRIVIDCGKVKTRFHIRGTSVDRLQVVPISQAQAWQRSGRAGRLGPGKCYRLYTAEDFGKMSSFPIPEIQRSNMAGVVLHLVKIGITSPLSFDWIDGPQKETLEAAIEELKNLEAIESEIEPLKLTKTGDLMSKIPLEPPLSKVLINATRFEVVEPVLTILSILSSESLFSVTDGKRTSLKKRFCDTEGDLISYLKIYREFRKTATKGSWCKMNGLNLRALQFAAKVRSHLKDICVRENIKLESTLSGANAYQNIRKCFFESLPRQVAFHTQSNRYIVKIPGQMGVSTKIHPASALFNSKAPALLFIEIIQVSKESHLMCHLSLVDPEWMKK